MTDEDPRAGHEAARLLAAAQDWLASTAPHLAPVDEEGRTCPCPLCRVVASVREADPDEVGRWVDAAVAGLGAALRDVVPTEPAASEEDTDAAPGPEAGLDAAPDAAEATVQDAPRVRRIPVDRTDTDPDPEDD